MLSATDFVENMENHSAERETDFDSAAWKKNPIFHFCQKPKLVFRSSQMLALWMNLPVSFVLATCLFLNRWVDGQLQKMIIDIKIG